MNEKREMDTRASAAEAKRRRLTSSDDDDTKISEPDKQKGEDTIDSNWVGNVKSKVQNTMGKQWREGRWNDFLNEVALWLREEEGRVLDDIIDTVAGLVKCAIMNKMDLIDVAGWPPTIEKLCTFLEAKGIPIAIGAKLYKKYIALPPLPMNASAPAPALEQPQQPVPQVRTDSLVEVLQKLETSQREAQREQLEAQREQLEAQREALREQREAQREQREALQKLETSQQQQLLQLQDYFKEKKTLVLSKTTGWEKNDLLDMLSLPEKGAFWLNKPDVFQQVDGFLWLDSDEDSSENREAYMTYLRGILQLPTDYALEDAQANRKLLSVELFRGSEESRNISGTTDVAIAKSVHVQNKVIRNSIEALLELKKPNNLREKDHTPQIVCEHLAASYLNSSHPVVSVLTDLNESWMFFWFAREENHSNVCLYELRLDSLVAAAEAKYILDRLFDFKSSGDTLPCTLFNRLSFEDVWDILQNKKKRSRREFDGDDNSSPDQDSNPSSSGGADQYAKTETDAYASSRNDGTSHQNNQGTASGGGGAPRNKARMLSLFAPPSERDVANELDLLDMVDENEQYEIVRSFAMKHIVPYMKGDMGN